jgi:hypothetical protein
MTRVLGLVGGPEAGGRTTTAVAGVRGRRTPNVAPLAGRSPGRAMPGASVWREGVVSTG